MKKSLQLIVMRMSVVLICCLFIGIESAGQNVQWALEGTKSNSPFHEGLADYIDSESWLHGFINTSGEIAIPAKYKSVRDFDSGMAVVKADNNKYGIIDRNGNFILQPIYHDIRTCDEASGMYLVEVDENNVGLFYGGRMVLKPHFKLIYTSNFPFIDYISADGISKVINLVSGDVLDGYSVLYSVVICKKNGKKCYFDKTTGERIDSTSLTVSSQGVMPFQDETTKLYGFKTQKNGTVIIQPKYKDITWGIWICDAITVTDSVSSDMPKKCKVVDCYGKEWDLCKDGNEYITIEGDYFIVFEFKDEKFYNALYTKQGEELMPMAEQSIGPIKGTEDWFFVYGAEKKIYDAKNNVSYPITGYLGGVSDGMISVHESQNLCYFVDAVTRKKIKGEFFYAEEFHEGLAYVQFTEDPYNTGFIDKKGNVVLRGSKQLEFKRYFSEGVVGASKHEDGNPYRIEGYIYNPLGHNDYIYNASSKMALDKYVIKNWKKIADEAYEKGQYGKAKDYYYKIMLNKPDDTRALIDYGSCMNNLGYYDEAIECFQLALDIDPSYELAQTNLDISLGNKQRREEREERERVEQENQSAQSSTFWDALGSFASMLGNFSGATNTYQPYSSFSSDYSSGSSNYQSQYNMWAKRAESNYNSLTNLGYSAKSKSGNRSGGTLQSMNGGNYILMKKNLRDAQHEMQRIRREAARNGVTIQQSPWETATVKY